MKCKICGKFLIKLTIDNTQYCDVYAGLRTTIGHYAEYVRIPNFYYEEYLYDKIVFRKCIDMRNQKSHWLVFKNSNLIPSDGLQNIFTEFDPKNPQPVLHRLATLKCFY